MRNLGSKEGLRVKFKDGICAKLCLTLCFESDWYLCNINESGWFLKQLSRSQFEKVTIQKSTAELWAVISNQMIKYQFPHTWFDQISDHKHFIYFYGKLYIKLLAQAANENTNVMASDDLLFLIKNILWNGFY